MFLLCTCFWAGAILAQKNERPSLNLDFELLEKEQAKGWQNFGKGDYKLGLDKTDPQQGNQAAFIEYEGGESDFKAWAYEIPAIYKGKKIKLTGYVKTENVSDGFAGLWMRIDPKVAFDNMQDRGIKGTTDWQKYEIELDLDPWAAKKIVVGGLLVGKGKMWVDNLTVTIDGKTLDKAPLRDLAKAEKDIEFNSDSKITTIELDEQKIEHLKQLGLIWGFLKYHHPKIALGDYNWDAELFRILPQIIASKSSSKRDKKLTKWIKKLGKFKPGSTLKAKEPHLKIKPDLDWITSSNLAPELRAELVKVKAANRSERHYYIGLNPGVGNPDFRHETGYYLPKYPDAGYRLLALYRYWNVIQYYFPYKNLIEEDWKDVLTEFIPKFIKAEDELAYKLAVLELIGRVKDTHANIWSEEGALATYWGQNSPAVKLTFVENKALVTGYIDERWKEETGLIVGDEIVKIKGESVTELVKKHLKYTPASNYPTQLRNIARKLLRTNDSILDIEFRRAGEIKRKSVKTVSVGGLNMLERYKLRDTCFKWINEDIAYLYLGSIQNNYLPNIFSEIKDSKGLIIDLRCYPSEFVVFTLGNYLMPESTAFVRFSNGSISAPGTFTYTESLNVGTKNKNYYKGKVVILINETTQSQAEYTTMAFRVAPQATVIGSTTAAADGNISPFYLPGGIRTVISGIGIYYPDKTETQRVGIIPDIELRPTVEGVQNGRDELLEKAVEVINGKK